MSADADSSRTSSTVPLHFCEPGHVLARDVHNQKGQKVVPRGKELTEKMLRRLTAAGIKRVVVYTEPDESRVIEPEVSDDKSSKRENVVRETGDEVIVAGDLTEDFKTGKKVVVEGNVEAGASLVSSANILVEGKVTSGTIESEQGGVDVRGGVEGQGIELSAGKLIRLTAVEDAQISLSGKVLIRDGVRNARLECMGDMVVNNSKEEADVRNSILKVEGRLLVDEVVSSSEQETDLIFRDPLIQKLESQRKKLSKQIEDYEKENERLRKVVETVRQLGDKVRELDEKKKKKLKEHADRYQRIQEKLPEVREEYEECNDRLQARETERRYFMRVRETLRANTTITMENSELQVSENERDVQLYKKSMIVIQSLDKLASENILDERELLKN